jgi:hypothetical protein
MSQDHHDDKNSPSQLRSERELLELRVDSKLTEAKEALRDFNKVELQRIAGNIHEPKLKRLRNWSGFIITVLIIGNIAGWYSVTERVHSEADRVINQKLVDPQLTNTLDEALSKKAIPFIAAQVHPLSEQIISLQSSIDAAQTQAKKLQDEQKLMTLLNRGELFDRDAIQELQTIASGTNETAPLANAMFNKVRRTLLLDRGATTFIAVQEDKVYGGPFTSDELAIFLLTAPSPALDGIVNIMGKQTLLVPKLVELAHQSKDLWTINRIAKALNDMTGVDFYPWDLKPLDDWWAKNSIYYTNWPYNQYLKAYEAFKSTHYEEALTNFESVLAIDPAADRSRALAVGCAIEIGNMPKAQQLNTNYATADGRWEHWAHCKMMLATNAIRQGTEEFVSLTKKNPTFAQISWIAEGNHILRQVDWTLYQKLMQTTNNTVPANITNSAP